MKTEPHNKVFTPVSRRQFTTGLFAGTAALGMAGGGAIFHQGADRTVVVGGGPAGVASAVKLKGVNPAASVLLVERDPRRLRSAPAGRHFTKPVAGSDLSALRATGVEVLLDDVVGVDWASARLDLLSGRRLAYDQLLLAPGTAAVDEDISGLDAVVRHRWPAAWGSVREARRLEAALHALPVSGHVVLRLPGQGLSHPEVALKRALDLAALLAIKDRTARLTVLQGAHDKTLQERYRVAIADLGIGQTSQWLTADEGGHVTGVDAQAGYLETSAGRLYADAVNFVSRHQAGVIARKAGLTDATGWCPVDDNGRSQLRSQAWVLGDARLDCERTVTGALTSAVA